MGLKWDEIRAIQCSVIDREAQWQDLSDTDLLLSIFCVDRGSVLDGIDGDGKDLRGDQIKQGDAASLMMEHASKI